MLLTEILVSNIKMRRCGVLKGMKNYNKQNTFDSSESTVRNPQTMPIQFVLEVHLGELKILDLQDHITKGAHLAYSS